METQHNENMRLRRTAIGVIGLCVFSLLIFKGAKNNPVRIKELEVLSPVAVPLIPRENPFDSVSLKAKSAYVWDASSGKALFELNSEDQLPLASLTKIMTAITARELLPEDALVTIDGGSLRQEGDSGLRPGEKWKLSDLLRFTLLVSSNDGAHAVANAFSALDSAQASRKTLPFIEAMNKNVEAIGLRSTYFINESGLDVSEGVSGGYGTARDVAKLFEYAVRSHPDIFDITKEKNGSFLSENRIAHPGENTNKITAKIPRLIASKTGLSELAGGNLVIEFEPAQGHPVVIVVLGSTAEGRFEDTLALVGATQKYFDDL